jgi:hypothetical protein
MSEELEEGRRRLRAAQDATDWIARQNVRVHELDGRVADLEAVLRDLLANGPGTDNASYEDRDLTTMHVRWGAYKAALATIGIVR